MAEKRFVGNVMRRRRIWLMRRPAAGGEARELLFYIKKYFVCRNCHMVDVYF